MHTVTFKTYFQSMPMFPDESPELEWDETVESEYETLEEAQKHADEDEEGCYGQYVEVYLDGEHYRDYGVE